MSTSPAIPGPYACFPLRSEWEAGQPPALSTYPTPLRTSRSAQDGERDHEAPLAVLRLAESAREGSWEVRAQWAEGCLPHGSTGRPTAERVSVALRFGAHPMTDRQAYAVYSRPSAGKTWSWKSIMIWGPDLPPFAGCSLADLQHYLSHPEIPAFAVQRWVKGLKDAAARTEAARKKRATVRAAIVKKASEGRFKAGIQESRLEYSRVDAEWRGAVADLADGVFTSEEVARLITPKLADRRSGL